MNQENKKRSVNFSTKEESILLSLVKKYLVKGSVIECKLTDTINANEKENYWKRIETEFNAINGETYRSEKVLHKKYDNIKKRAKKKFAEEKCHMRATGGGPDVKWTEADTDIKEILGTRMEGLPSEFDNDSQVIIIEEEIENTVVNEASTSAYSNGGDTQISIDLTELENPIMTVVDHDYIIESSEENVNLSISSMSEVQTNMDEMEYGTSGQKWAKYTPTMLRSKKSRALIPNIADAPKHIGGIGDITNKISQWATTKCAFESSKEKQNEAEHRLKLDLIREKHNMELDLLKEESKKKIQMLEAEHKIRLEILMLQKTKLHSNN